QIVRNEMAQVGQCFVWNELRGKGVDQSGQHLLFDLAQGHVVTALFSGKLCDRKVCRKVDRHSARFARFLTDDLFAKLWQKIVGRDSQPKLLSAVKGLA